MSDKKALVALAKEASIQDSVTKVFDLMGGVTNMIKPGTTVMLKPNAGHASPADTSSAPIPRSSAQSSAKSRKPIPRALLLPRLPPSAAIPWNAMRSLA